jgi:hypothetical protein
MLGIKPTLIARVFESEQAEKCFSRANSLFKDRPRERRVAAKHRDFGLAKPHGISYESVYENDKTIHKSHPSITWTIL